MFEHLFAVCLWRVDGHLVRCLGVFYRVSVWSSQGDVLAVYGLGYFNRVDSAALTSMQGGLIVQL